LTSETLYILRWCIPDCADGVLASMDAAPLPDLDTLDRNALTALILANQKELGFIAASYENEFRSLQPKLNSHARRSPNTMKNCVPAVSRSNT
jgi:hypothetical protein